LFIQSLALHDFRNYRDQHYRFTQPVTILSGENAQGKTNFLESIYLISSGRSPRERKNKNLIAFDQANAQITAELQTGARNYRATLQINADEKRLTVDHSVIQRASDWMGTFNAIYLSPADLELVIGEPGGRRAFLDLLLTRQNRSYLHTAQQYQQLLKNRNSALKQSAFDSGYLDTLDAQLAETGSAMIRGRTALLTELDPLVATQLTEIINAPVILRYQPGGSGAVDVYRDRLAQKRHLDQLTGTTSVGPHRDDFIIMTGDKEARLFASNGQQRAIALALRLAEAQLLRDAAGSPPVLLFDDVLLELDEPNTAAILTAVSHYEQILMTTTAVDQIPQAVLGRADIVQVQHGTLFHPEAL